MTEETNIAGESAASQKTATKSLKDFAASPFRKAMWETVGDALSTGLGFSPLELSVVGERPREDSMFESFDPKGDEANRKHEGFASATESIVNGEVESAAVGPSPEQLAAVHQAGFEEGFQRAREELAELAATETAEMKAHLQQLTESIQLGVKEVLEAAERESVALAIAVAKKILETTAEAKPEYIAQVISHAMKSLGAAHPLQVRLSPQDFEFIKLVGLPPELSAGELGLKYVSDEQIKSGCVVDTDFGQIDLQLDTMWEQIRDRLFEVVK